MFSDESSLFQQSRRKNKTKVFMWKTGITLMERWWENNTYNTCTHIYISISLTNGGGLPRLHCGNYFLIYIYEIKWKILFVCFGESRRFISQLTDISTRIDMRVCLERHNRKSINVDSHTLNVVSTWESIYFWLKLSSSRRIQMKNVTKVTWKRKKNQLPLATCVQ